MCPFLGQVPSAGIEAAARSSFCCGVAILTNLVVQFPYTLTTEHHNTLFTYIDYPLCL